MKHLNHKIAILFCATCLIAGLLNAKINVFAADRAQDYGDELVIVIDPGHGGSNGGTTSGHTIEKQMTMVTAMAMYEDLTKYDNVQVYMTHTEDIDMDLKQRAEFAQSVNADFLFSIHYNASENHTMFGSEVWVSCVAPYNSYGYQFGYLHLKQMQDNGLFIRGVKNRLNEQNTDYYGIIRESAALSVPAVIIEHCYVDEERDAEFVENEEDFAAFGRADALSVAKYFGLKSTALGVDYSAEASNLQPVEADKLVQSTLLDKTKPDVCEIELLECDYETGDVQITVRAADYDSPLIFYSYTINGGADWSRLEPWPGSNTLTGEYTDTFQLNLQIPLGKRPNIAVRAINIADLETKSNTLRFDQTFQAPKEEDTAEAAISDNDLLEKATPATTPVEHERKTIGTTTFMPVYSEIEEEEDSVSIMTFLKLCLVLVIILFFVVLTSQMVHYHKRKKHRQRR